MSLYNILNFVTTSVLLIKYKKIKIYCYKSSDIKLFEEMTTLIEIYKKNYSSQMREVLCIEPVRWTMT